MYNPSHFQESDPDVLAAFCRAHPLAALVTCTAGGTIDVNHIPIMLLDAGDEGLMLRGHVARANPLWGSIADGAEVLVVFGGAERYISPSWYPSKAEHGRVVPTWNYAVVHARGAIRFVHDVVWLRQLVEMLTDAQEAPRAQPWSVTDAPEEYVASRLRAIVGFEIAVSQLEGKFKASQNRPQADRAGVIEGLRDEQVAPAAREELVRAPRG
jgi:transcriptional regulator